MSDDLANSVYDLHAEKGIADIARQRMEKTMDTITGLLHDVLRDDYAIKAVDQAPARHTSPWWGRLWISVNVLGAAGFAGAAAYTRKNMTVCAEDSVCTLPSIGDTYVWKWSLWAMFVFAWNGLGSLTSYALRFARHDVVRCNTRVIAACVPSILGYVTAEILLVREGRVAIWVLRTLLILLTATILWALKGVFVVFVDRKFCPPCRIQKQEDMVRREKILSRFLDSSVLQGNSANIPAIKGVTCVNAVSLQYVSLLKHFLADGKWHDPTSALDKPDDLFARVERLETELALLIPHDIKRRAEEINVSLSSNSINEWIKSIKRITPPSKSLRDARIRKIANKWRRRASEDDGISSSSSGHSLEAGIPAVVREYAVKTRCVRTMLSDLRMTLPMGSFRLPGATESSRPGAVKVDDLYAKKLGFYIFWQLKQDVHRIEIVPKDLHPFFDSDDERDTAWSELDCSFSGQVDLVDCVQFVKDFSKLRREVACMKLDSRGLMSRIDQALTYSSVIILVLLTLEVTEIAQFSNIWQACSAAVLVFSFIFGNSIRQVWENLIYILSVRAFDVGDTIIVNGSRQRVNRIMLGFVECTGPNNTLVSIPMQHFLDKEVVNVTRTVDEWADIEILVDINTTTAQLTMVAQSIAYTIFENKSLFAGLYRVFLKPSGTVIKSWTMVVRYNLRGNGTDLVEHGRAETIMCVAVAAAMAGACVNATQVPMCSSTSRLNTPLSSECLTEASP
jgi:small-conductance mechanosensitive channel